MAGATVDSESAQTTRQDEDEPMLLAASVHRRLREQILAGELEPGAPLSVPAFAASLGVSRSPVREAVQQLMFDGLAVHVPYAGARVARIDETDVRSAFAVRRELEGLAAAEASRLVSAAGIEGLRTILERQEERIADDADDRLLDIEFHAAIRAISGNRHLIEALERLEVLSHLYRGDMWAQQTNRRLALAEHRRIVDAIERGDPAEARAAAGSHVAGVLVRMFRPA